MSETHEPHGNHEEHEEGAEHGEHEHEHGLAHEFLEKAISLRSMDPGLLVLTLLAMVMVVGAGILIMTRDLPWPQVRVNHEVVAQTIPLPVMIFAAFLMVLFWSYILAGALHSHLIIRIVGMLAWTFGNLPLLVASSVFYSWIAYGMLFLLAWLMAITMYLVDRFYADRHTAGWHHRFRLRISTFLFFAVITGLLIVFGVIGGLHNGSLGFALNLQLSALQFVLIPMLYLAGTDFAEWSEVIAGRVGSVVGHISGRFATWVTAGLIVIVVGLILAERVSFLTARGAAILIGESMIPLGLMAIVGWIAIRRGAVARIPFYALVVVALVGYGTMIAGSVLAINVAHANSEGSSSEGEYVQYVHEEKPVFTVSYNKGWTPSPEHVPGGEESEAVVFRDTDSSGLPVRFAVLAVPKDTEGDPLTTVVAPLLKGQVTPSAAEPREQGEWQVRDYTMTADGTEFQGRAWTRTENGQSWLLTGVSPLVSGGTYDETFSHVVSTWEPKAAAEEGGNSDSGPNEFAFDYTAGPVLWVIVIVISVFLLRRGGMSATAGLFMITGAIFYLGYGVRFLFAMFLGQGPHLELPLPWWIFPPDMENTIGAVAVWVLVALVALLVTGRLRQESAPLLRLLLVLLLGFVGLRLIYTQVFGSALSAGERFPAVQALFLMLALLWDIAMSGENLTNREGDHVPRHSRVLMYFGYTMGVATAVLFFSSIRGPGEKTEFESDTWPQLGILLMGVPVVLTFFFSNVGIWLRRRRREAGGPPESSPPGPELAEAESSHPG